MSEVTAGYVVMIEDEYDEVYEDEKDDEGLVEAVFSVRQETVRTMLPLTPVMPDTLLLAFCSARAMEQLSELFIVYTSVSVVCP